MFKGVSKVFQGYFKEVLVVFRETFKVDSREKNMMENIAILGTFICFGSM